VGLHNLVDDVVVGAMGAQNAMSHFRRGALLITPGDREELSWQPGHSKYSTQEQMAGIVLTGNMRQRALCWK